MEIKKYKVVCSKPRFSDTIFIDIAPDSGVIHDQIFFSRIQLYKQPGAQPLDHLYGSIYLQDINGEVSVEFPEPQARKNSPDYAGIIKEYDKLRPQIINRYREMCEIGQDSTLFIYGINDMFELSAEKNAEAKAFERRRCEKMKAVAQKTSVAVNYKQKHLTQIYPQTPQQERMLKKQEIFAQAQRHRIVSEQKRATEVIPAWLKFQKTYSGD